MKIEELNKDDYYYAQYDNDDREYVIAKGTEGSRPNLYCKRENNTLNYESRFFLRNTPAAWNNIRLATPEEIHWLNCCIESNKYITLEDALKSYISPNKQPEDMNYLVDLFKDLDIN